MKLFLILHVNQLFDAQLDTAAIINVQYHNLDLLTNLQVIIHIVHTLFSNLGDVNQAILTRQDVNECTEFHDTGNSTFVDLANFCFSSDAVNLVVSNLAGIFVFAIDLNNTIVSNIDGAASLFTQTTNSGTTLTNNITDLVWDESSESWSLVRFHSARNEVQQ